MSKKTIVFKMPAGDAIRREGETSDAAPPIEAASPAVSTGESRGVEPDAWVQRRQASPAPISRATAGKGHLTIDLALERDLGEVAALSLALPAMLGWFWFANAADRYRRIFTL
jgi:hypothetical protein